MSDAIANALRIAAPNDMGGISRALIDALRQKAASGDPNAQAGMAQHDAAMTNPLWGSSTYLSQQPANNLGEALQKVPPEAMFLSNFLGPAPKRIPNPIKAYHGSPHDFEKFDLSKIGTGEGAQAFGHGLYFSEKPDVAQYYREALSSRPAIEGKPILDQQMRVANSTGHPFLDQELSRAFGDVALARQTLEANLKAGIPSDLPFWQQKAKERIANSEAALARLDELEKTGALGRVSPGKTYEVAIHATPDQFLDWDKPLSQQSEAVRKALEPFGFKTDKVGMKAFDDALAAALEGDGPTTLPEQPRDPLGSDIVRKLHSQNGSSWLEPNKTGEGNATAALREQGVSGIRYLDQGSRGAGHGTSNFVVFDPSIIEILRKYGLLGPIAAGAVANSLGGDGNQ